MLYVVKEERQQNMSPLNYSPEQKVMLDRLLLDHPEVSADVIFELPCYKVNGIA